MTVESLSQVELRTLLSPRIMLTSLGTELWFSCQTWLTPEKGTAWQLLETNSFTLLDLDSTTPQKLVKFTRSKTIAGEKSLSSTAIDTCLPLSRSNKGTFTSLVGMNHPSLTSRGLTLSTRNSQLSGSWSKCGVPPSKPISSTGSEHAQSLSKRFLFSEARKTVPQAHPHTFLTLSRIKSRRPALYQTKTHSTSALSFAKTGRFMLMGMRTITLTSTIWEPRPGPRNDCVYFNQINQTIIIIQGIKLNNLITL